MRQCLLFVRKRAMTESKVDAKNLSVKLDAKNRRRWATDAAPPSNIPAIDASDSTKTDFDCLMRPDRRESLPVTAGNHGAMLRWESFSASALLIAPQLKCRIRRQIKTVDAT